jgi:hypothetical protein
VAVAVTGVQKWWLMGERSVFRSFAKCWERACRGLKYLGHGQQMRDVPL